VLLRPHDGVKMIRRFCDYCDVDITKYDHKNRVWLSQNPKSAYSDFSDSNGSDSEVCDVCYDRIEQAVKISKRRYE
jgi:hypothetical protein